MLPSSADPKPSVSLLVIINPAAGDGSALAVYTSHVLPVLTATSTHFIPTVIVTEKPLKLMWTLRCHTDLLSFDAIAACGGDGLIHEIINGILTRPDWTQACKIPIIPIPVPKARNSKAFSLRITNPLISALTLAHISDTDSKVGRVGVPVVGVTTAAGLRVFAHSDVCWRVPVSDDGEETGWSSSAIKRRRVGRLRHKSIDGRLMHWWDLLEDALSFRRKKIDHSDGRSYHDEREFLLHYCGSDDNAPSNGCDEHHGDGNVSGPIMRNQPGPPLRFPCMAPSTLPVTWRSLCCSNSRSSHDHAGDDSGCESDDVFGGLDVSVSSSPSSTSSLSPSSSPSSTSPSFRSPHLSVGLCTSSSPPTESVRDSLAHIQPSIETQALIVSLSEPSPIQEQQKQRKLGVATPNSNSRFAGGVLTIDGQCFEPGPFAAEVVVSRSPVCMMLAPSDEILAAAAALGAAGLNCSEGACACGEMGRKGEGGELNVKKVRAGDGSGTRQRSRPRKPINKAVKGRDSWFKYIIATATFMGLTAVITRWLWISS